MRVRQTLMGAALVAVLGAGTAWAQETPTERAEEKVERGVERAEEPFKKWEQEHQGKKMGKAQEEKQAALLDIALHDMEQIALGKLARDQSDNPQVKQFANQLIQSHQQNLDTLNDYAVGQDLTLAMVDLSQAGTAVGGGGMPEPERMGEEKGAAKEARRLDKKEQKRVDDFIVARDQLATRSGSDFDRDFLKQVRANQEDQAKAIKDTQRKYRDDAALSEALSGSQPTMQQNEQQLRQLEKSVKRQG
ncbi:MAG: DUF4142 domain-containing protein [Myxococcaceae bacterium]|nr:DUF4142 domain-containing protein [Myxococcaceae bacterium]MCI0669904.1 DUF4142 domain-containing protein [Myxococcaceae bacterium]